ncbi:plasmid replication-associated protein [Staphylococcus aureus]|uniref:plasmid replication-associated protein n=1 Tax=Staphylococcus aureus TaxID=1280 RepID=UPI00202982E1|nr:plasmid replication-associated protein [Staphylococcus aureus]MCL9702430.1 plasmid replication-associated protein [Staphylococcus aureus]MCO4428185.1 plasmid replication-associated protein [Staphylococcus aureus]UXT11139.1 plasmid replication-associated protein [Staphylococcus aureus]UXT19164.1 plasmid replication-associated protein [Staphylococcus aureus]UXU11620.1 plasmid replication-associated protein [Staphylococcus aureus]
MTGFLDSIKGIEQQKRGFLDDIDTSAVKYTENYKPMAKSATMRVDTLIKKRLSQMALDKDTSIKAISDKVLNEFLEKNNY